MTNAICTVEGCNRAVVCRGMCGKHYQRWRKHGDTETVLTGGAQRKDPTPCNVAGCDRHAVAKGFCWAHWSRQRKTGDVAPDRAIGLNSTPVINGKKACTKCRKEKPLNAFQVSSHSPSGYHSTCKACRSEARKAQYAANPEPFITYKRWATIKSVYKLTREQYMEMFNAQGGKCAICRQSSDRHLSVDHDHACCPGRRSCGNCIRQLLCAKCNTLLGLANDDPQRLEQAIAYLRREWPCMRNGFP